jgi:hypothetical protein
VGKRDTGDGSTVPENGPTGWDARPSPIAGNEQDDRRTADKLAAGRFDR